MAAPNCRSWWAAFFSCDAKRRHLATNFCFGCDDSCVNPGTSVLACDWDWICCRISFLHEPGRVALSLSWTCSMDCAFSYGSSHFCCRIGRYCNHVEMVSHAQKELLSQHANCILDCDTVDREGMGGYQLALRWFPLVKGCPGPF